MVSPVASAARRGRVGSRAGKQHLFTIAERPELRAHLRALDALAFPAFMERSDLTPLWPTIYDEFADWQVVACGPRGGDHLAHANAVPFAWDGSLASLPRTAVELVALASEHRRAGRAPNALGALQVVVRPALQGRGLSARLLRAVAALAAARGMADLFAPIRPNRKASQPHTPFAGYVEQTLADGLPTDPWQRVHARLGARPVGIAGEWLTVVAPVHDWEALAGMCFATTGRFVVLGALAPVAIDLERGTGRYAEPHLWMRYQLARKESAEAVR
jgi:GNAT superfamily N-acetyltransferase